MSVEVRKSQHKYIVGPRGHVLQEILQTTGVWVDVPSTESDSSTITLRGTQDKLGQALTQVCGGEGHIAWHCVMSHCITLHLVMPHWIM